MYTILAFWPFIPALNHAINSSNEAADWLYIYAA